MNPNHPKVSIIMGIYNCEDTLKDSIESIINQTYKNWEMIICDDCSKDKSYSIAKYYERMYKNQIKVIRNKQNLTLGPTLNRCLKIATGKYIARQDADDMSEKDRLYKQIKFLEENISVDLVGSGMKIFDNRGIYGRRLLKYLPEGKDMLLGTTFAHATIVTRKYVYEKLNGYSENYNRRGVEDYDMWFRFYKYGFKGVNIREELYCVREDREAYSRKNFKRRINEIRTMIYGINLLNLGITKNIFIIKPMLITIIPSSIMMMYHRKKSKI